MTPPLPARMRRPRRAGVRGGRQRAPGAAAPIAPAAPRMPKRPPRPPIRYAPLDPRIAVARRVSMTVAAAVLVFLANLLVFSHLQHLVSQQWLDNDFRQSLADGTAPVSEGDYNGQLLPDGAAVARIEIPAIGVHETVVEGTSSADLMRGPGHRRDTVLPGQLGTSVVYGRAAAYGGPFANIQQLQPDDTITVVTGQGKQTFKVVGVRYAGDPKPTPDSGAAWLTLVTAKGMPYAPSGLVYVDAKATAAQPDGARQTTTLALPRSNLALATDTSTVWALVFALQLLVAVELTAVWAARRLPLRKVWLAAAPATLLACVFVSTQLLVLLPNLL